MSPDNLTYTSGVGSNKYSCLQFPLCLLCEKWTRLMTARWKRNTATKESRLSLLYVLFPPVSTFRTRSRIATFTESNHSHFLRVSNVRTNFNLDSFIFFFKNWHIMEETPAELLSWTFRPWPFQVKGQSTFLLLTLIISISYTFFFYFVQIASTLFGIAILLTVTLYLKLLAILGEL